MNIILEYLINVFRYWNPFVIPYYVLRVLVRIIIGRKRRNWLFFTLGWFREDGWFKWLGLPPTWIYKFTVTSVRRSVSRKFLRHELAVSTLIEKKHGDLFIDIGASWGYYSFLLHNNFKEIIAFEPHPNNIAIINGVKQMGRYSNVKVLGKAVGDKNGQATLFIGQHSGGHSLLYDSRLIKDDSFITVPTVTLTKFLGDKVVDLIKVDVEGAEWMVLKGAERVMQNIKSWVIEVHNLDRLNEMEKLLQSHGYKTKWLDQNHIHAWRREE